MSLDFSVAQAKEYLDGQSVEKTLFMLRREGDALSERLLRLARKKELIEERISALSNARKIKPGRITLKKMPERSCVGISERITRDEEMDFAVKKLHMQHAGKIRNFGNQTIGAFLSADALADGIANVYDSVFFVLDEPCIGESFILPEGCYLSCFYRGAYTQNAIRAKALEDYAEQKGFTALGHPFELYRIDSRDTALEEEFLTEIQLNVTRGNPHGV